MLETETDMGWVDKLLGPLAVYMRRYSIKWKGSIVPFTAVNPRQARRLCRAMIGHGHLPRAGYEVCLAVLPSGCRLWLANQSGNLDWCIGASAWGSSPLVLKII
jgi:hypothetical protein